MTDSGAILMIFGSKKAILMSFKSILAPYSMNLTFPRPPYPKEKHPAPVSILSFFPVINGQFSDCPGPIGRKAKHGQGRSTREAGRHRRYVLGPSSHEETPG